MAVEVRQGTGTKNYGLYIDGEYRLRGDEATLPVINPATGEQWATIVDASAEDVETAVAAARRAFEGDWGKTSPGTRARLLHRLADAVESRAAELAEIEVRDNGKLLREMGAQLRAIPGWYRYYAGLPTRSKAKRFRWNARRFSISRCASRSASSASSRPGTHRFSFSRSRLLRRLRRAMRSCSNPANTHRCPLSSLRNASRRPAFRRASSTS